jgi:Lipocalin-like domain
MNRRTILSLSSIAALGLTLLPGSAISQEKSLKDQLVGPWTLASAVSIYQDGRKVNPWGPDVKGAVNFNRNGQFTFIIIGAELKSPSGVPEESQRLVVAYFGKYIVDEAAKTVTYTAERATTPRFDGLARKASVTVNGDEFMQASAAIAGPEGTFTPNLVFKRVK